MTKTLQGKVALVSGASKGIGAEIALQLAAQGAAVAVNYASSKQGADAVVAQIAAAGGKAVAVHGNLADPTAIKPMIDATVKALGPIDVLVNNAGVYDMLPLDAITPEHFHRQFDLNVLGLLLVTQAAARQFSAAGGSIINISSGISTLAPPNSAVYTATKAAVDAITAVLARELAPRKIRVNAVNPGMVVTEGVKTAGYDQGAMRQWVEATTPLGRVGKAEEIAAVVTFLAGEGASYVTGETLHVTGGPR
ncbi:Short-chain dehydrogenase/reductase SDR [Rhodopseudomonas palustris HaA2]|uniref:Short-chain dehydrogenase/reductase SDR n=1 Tax=Rhodopseudomonas palustris (strain HaA2) TaxID=316058 RepID=Q2IV22_RHOP2|nr:glucose 1-dehydrogenase [Rhodopseudomonas palustris]ABD07938.1 Short-chain dehydrogenase/reductase SDR [Rhodopseudomonas palustris HaA2]